MSLGRGAMSVAVLGILSGVVPVMGPSVAVAAAPGVVTSCLDSGVGSLREIVSSSTIAPITFKVSCPSIVVTAPIVLTRSVEVRGPGSAKLAIDGNGTAQLFVVSAGVTAAISGLTLSNGRSADGGGAIVNNGVLTVDAVDFRANVADLDGGAILNLGELVVRSSTFSQNRVNLNCGPFGCYSAGGAILNAGTMTVEKSVFTNNAAMGDPQVEAIVGGAIYVDVAGRATVDQSSFVGNTANLGGALFAYGGAWLSVSGSEFSQNVAQAGGAIESDLSIFTSIASTLIVSHSTFTGNLATGLPSGETVGGAIEIWGGTATIEHSSFTGNAARAAAPTFYASGGAIASFDAALTLDHVDLTGNVADAAPGYALGGAIWNMALFDDAPLAMSFVTASGNRASAGAVIFQYEAPGTSGRATTTVDHSRFTDNVSSPDDIVPGIFLGSGDPSELMITHSIFR